MLRSRSFPPSLIPILLCLPAASGLKECKKVDVCKCSTDEGIIDLWKLQTDQVPRFQNIPAKGTSPGNTVTASWNPCTAWTLDSADQDNYCKDVAVCITANNVVHLDFGEQDTADFQLNSTSALCYLKYSGYISQQHQFKSLTYITLVCDENEEGRLEMSFSDEEVTARGRLISKYACPIKSLSTGSILLIIFFSLFLVYVVVGVSYNKFARGSSGKELIPNYSFWMDFPVLVKDGLVFFYQACKKLCDRNKDAYSSI